MSDMTLRQCLILLMVYNNLEPNRNELLTSLNISDRTLNADLNHLRNALLCTKLDAFDLDSYIIPRPKNSNYGYKLVKTTKDQQLDANLKDRLNRVVIFYLALNKGYKITKEDYLAIFNVSYYQFKRDIAILRTSLEESKNEAIDNRSLEPNPITNAYELKK